MQVQGVFSMRVAAIGLISGVIFAVMDGLINASPLAQRLFAFYRPIVRASVNAPLGLAFDCVSGILMAMLFAVLSPALPDRWISRGVAFGLIAWFFRVAMSVASQAVMFRVPGAALLYTLFTGLAEMLTLGLFYAVSLRRG